MTVLLAGCGGGAAARWAPLPSGSPSGVLPGRAPGRHVVSQTVLPLHHRRKGEDRPNLNSDFSSVDVWNPISVCLCQGVVSGILVVTPTKIFFDPSKTHPLVTEHGFEDYLLSCAVDSLASVSFFSDVSHVRFSTSQQRSVLFHCCAQMRQIGSSYVD